MGSEFTTNDIVWAKMKGFPPWPGKVVEPKLDKNTDKKLKKQYIFFFGSENYAWVTEDLICPYLEFKDKYKTPARILKGFNEAIEMAEEHIKKFPLKQKIQMPPRKRLLEKTLDSNLSSRTKVTSAYNAFDDSPAPKKMTFSGSYDKNRSSEHFLPDILPSASSSTSILSRNIIATPMRIGFLGLGAIGSGAVHNLLASGHEVTVWNRTTSKCYEFTKAGALKGSTPAEVVQSCDLTFSCVSDPSALKDLVFGNHGVLQGISSGKGYVDMSTVDVETITDIQEAIVGKGGRFMEAPVLGNRLLSKDGQLIVLAAGDKTLYDDCYSCFQAISKYKFHLGEVGSATKMKLVLTILFGCDLAGLAECLALSSKLGLDSNIVMKVISHSSINSHFLQEKGADMINKRITEPLCKLQVMQKELRLGINMSDTVDQSMPVSSAVNELFKKAKAKGYGEDDIASLYRAAEL